MSLLEIKDKVQRYLMDMGLHGIELMPDGYTFRFGSTRMFIGIDEYGEGEDAFTAAVLNAPIVMDVTPSPELFEYIARHADDKLFGHLGLHENEENKTMTIVFSHTLLLDFLDPEELRRAVGAVAGVADDLDNELAALFSGKVFHED